MTAALAYNQRTGDYDVHQPERVLAFPAEVLEEHWPANTTILTDPLATFSVFQNIIQSGKLQFIERGPAETDPTWKQLIPYVVFRRGNDVTMYQRTSKGNETRLHNLYSLGIGGHINPEDGEAIDDRVYWRGQHREMIEEVGITRGETDSCPMVGLIYDPSNAVGQVHFGVVHFYWASPDTRFVFNDPAVGRGQWMPASVVKTIASRFENWSQLVIEKLL
jgi:predicted NUDIX family phosphoesterase